MGLSFTGCVILSNTACALYKFLSMKFGVQHNGRLPLFAMERLLWVWLYRIWQGT
jgi:hypothetical protein